MSTRPFDPGPGRGRSLAEPGRFVDDDGSPDLSIRQAVDSHSLLAAVKGGRVLVAVTAVATDVDEHGADKTSDMAVVSMVTADGRKGLLAFTGTDALAAWDPSARPVPVSGFDAALAALDDGCQALVVDVCGPRTQVLVESDLLAMVERDPIEHACALLQEHLHADGEEHEVEVVASDTTIQVRCPADLAEQIAQELQRAPRILALVPGGIQIHPI